MDKSILAIVYESAKGLYDAGLINAVTMREFDAMCLSEVYEMNPKEIKKLRLRERVSQAVFAKFLNISSSTVQHWETGEKRPSGAALKLLNIIKEKGLVAVS